MRGRGYGGFKGSKRLQGGWLGALISLGTALFTSSQANKQQKEANKQLEKSDPYGKYRDAAALSLNKLTTDPSSIVDTAEYKARQVAASRLMASQGYTGSGNAVVAAAEAGGASYQQAFDNLARQAGIDVQPGGSAAALSNVSNSRDNYLSGIAGVANAASNLAGTIFNKGGGGTAIGIGKGS